MATIAAIRLAGAAIFTGTRSRPEVEILCGGINDKTARAAGLWRQGNLLHFGFEQSPAELNETGRVML